MAGDWKRLAVSWSAPLDGHHVDALHNKRGRALTVPSRPPLALGLSSGAALTMARWNLCGRQRFRSAEFGSQGDVGPLSRRSRAGRTIVRVLPNERSLPGEASPTPERANEHSAK